MLNDRLQLDVEVFHWRYKDQQVSAITQDSQGVTNLATQNVGNATMNGVEVGTEWLVSDATRLSLDAQYLDATYDDFQYVTPPPPIAGPPLTGCAVTPGLDGLPGGLLRKAGTLRTEVDRQTWPPSTRSRSPTMPGSWPTPACTIRLRC